MTGSMTSRSARTRNALLTAALQRFLDHGVATTSVADIAADAGVTERTFYRYFPSKEHILFSDYDARLDWFRAALRVRPPRESLVVSVRAAVESFPYDNALLEIAALRTRELEIDTVNAHLRRVQADFADEIVQHLRRRRGTADDGDAVLRDRLQAQMITSAMFTALGIWLNAGTDDFTDLERLIDSALRIIGEGVR
ncbi:TetR family transcriptional regulator [Mycolicibacterium fluoranthenivorans]|uniref:TetR family transcriptional regulator n=1 Tax=Mycolicibacterium fluoranthenivorans TaxID=258505 RepID=A0A7G8P6X5_9MYCO|nr:TetR family transcriptional regulator [Mycolicibacterium fluoranthenivorans]QNJ90091.1 TetR family transcriptional regulator [Mycolicibacterium fluoranthenivorans]